MWSDGKTPVVPTKDGDDLKTSEKANLYELIVRQFLSSFMNEARLSQVENYISIAGTTSPAYGTQKKFHDF